jgi:hypothetical protein
VKDYAREGVSRGIGRPIYAGRPGLNRHPIEQVRNRSRPIPSECTRFKITRLNRARQIRSGRTRSNIVNWYTYDLIVAVLGRSNGTRSTPFLPGEQTQRRPHLRWRHGRTPRFKRSSILSFNQLVENCSAGQRKMEKPTHRGWRVQGGRSVAECGPAVA